MTSKTATRWLFMNWNCTELLKGVKADVVHLDMSLGRLPLEELSAVSLSQIHVSSKARLNLLKILPTLRKLALDIKRSYDIEVLAIGKESIPVRIAELTCGAHAVIYAVEKALTRKNASFGFAINLPNTIH